MRRIDHLRGAAETARAQRDHVFPRKLCVDNIDTVANTIGGQRLCGAPVEGVAHGQVQHLHAHAPHALGERTFDIAAQHTLRRVRVQALNQPLHIVLRATAAGVIEQKQHPHAFFLRSSSMTGGAFSARETRRNTAAPSSADSATAQS